MRILVVDDSAVTRTMIKRTLGLVGFATANVREAEDGRSAIRALATEAAELLITDLNMPGMGGVDLVRAVRTDPILRSITILVVSTDTTPARRRVMAELGVDGYLGKPFRPEDLAALVAATRGAA